ncbi:MAG TPA: PEGA domain-containing protein [Vicinamibacterales bacterium]|nr:PEGA domain-containing protein [Vicinamibacterales bacterium]
MSQQEPDARTEQDPLLEYVTEHQPQEATVSEAVAPAPERPPDQPDPIAILAARVDQLERSVERTSKQLRSLTSEVATIVSARRNNPAPSIRHARVPAAVGLAAGLLLAMWLWPYPTGVAEQPPSPIPSPAAVEAAAAETTAAPEPAPQPVPLKVAAPVVTPVRPAPARENPRRVDYFGTLSIDASPAADVFINRRPAGRTPVRLTELKAGSHLVWIQREGFRRFTRVVQVPADRVTRVSATLDPLATR